MNIIQNTLTNKDYICNTPDTIFTMLMRHAFKDNPGNFPKLSNTFAVHGLLQYPHWEPTTDIFCYIKPEYLTQIQNKETFFIFDASTEGFVPFKFFNMLYFNCKKYNVDPRMVIYVSSNLQDEENIKDYANKHNVAPLNVFSFVSFEQVLAVDGRKVNEALPIQYQTAVNKCNKKFNDKYFSSLSRLNRHYRSVATFILFNSKLRNKALISHDKINDALDGWIKDPQLSEYTPKHIKRWTKSLPLIVDRKNFDRNWAINTPYRDIHDQTIFQIVNETEVDNSNGTALFYSEKTFRPVAHFQPFVIYGQKGCNHHLKNIGYKLYDEWFDLSFDFENDNIIRYKKLLASITDVCNRLDSMTRDQKIEWRFKNNEILKHNFKTMIESSYSKQKLLDFLQELEEKYEIN